ncbi:hypothetical protein C8T65DRAFT_635567 [Cerioporus squamosus]|nr:hypothetical protein C8T65DRAFT_635567 [Cerioporus squamosus]
MTDSPPHRQPGTHPGASGIPAGSDGNPASDAGRREGGDRREEEHEAPGAGANRAQDCSRPGTDAAHRPAGDPDRTPSVSSRSHSRRPSAPTATSTSIASLPREPSSRATASSPSPVSSTPMLSPALLGILQCPLCLPPALLRAPVTLHCGHTLCASHLSGPHVPSTSKSSGDAPTLPRCPLPLCSSSPRSPAVFSHVPPVDVTTNKLIDILVNASHEEEHPNSPPPSFHDDPDDCTDSEYEADSDSDLEYLPLPPQSPPADGPSHTSAANCGPPSRTSTTSSGSSGSRRQRSPSGSGSSPMLHPRKRRRRVRRTVSSHQPHRTDHDPTTRLKKELLSELTCEICFGLFWEPITTPCQHTFCRRCLFRSLDHSQTCPLCRAKLPGYDYFQQHPYNKVILAIIIRAFPDAYRERGDMIEAEERDARLNTPVFVCQLSFPGMPTILHFFEPRYRLMLRRCLESPNPCFGMIPPPRAAPSTSAHGTTSTGNDYGTMLQIRNVQMLPDGRSVVETWGTWRFRIMERGMRDGYMVARIERIEDYEEELDEPAAATPSSADARQEPSRQPGHATSSRTEEPPGRTAERTAESRAEAAVRAEIGDVFVELPPDSASGRAASVSAGAHRPGTPLRSSVARSDAAVPAIAPSPSASGRGEDRSGGLPSEKQLNAIGATPRRAPSNAELMAKCHAFIEQTRRGTPWVVQHLHENFLLPIDEHEKAKLLPIRSPRLRLRLVVHWIEQLNSQWASAYASASALQVVLWRVRYFMMLPRAARLWFMLLAYAALLAAVYFGQTMSGRVGVPARSSPSAPAGSGEL